MPKQDDDDGPPPNASRGVGSSDDRTPPGGSESMRESDPGTTDGFTPATIDDASGYGLSLTLVGGVLLALAYYGYLAVTGPQTLGQTIPTPFYLLVFALLFVLELFQSRDHGGIAVVRATALAIFYGGLTVFAIEGGVYLVYNPDAALDGFVGVTVLAISLVVAALAYFLYLSALESAAAG